MANRRQNTRDCRETLTLKSSQDSVSFVQLYNLPPMANSGNFLDQGLPLLLLLPEEETILSGYALIIHDMDRNVSGFYAIECFF
jgi:hypothetical protein